ncbi:MAG: D-glycerate dehydrogenase [Anaerolineae bacterium]
MSKPKVLVTRLVPEAGLNIVRENCDADVWESDMPIPRDELLRRVRDIEGLYALLTERVDAELLDAAPKLKVVSNMAVGFDNIDVPECTRRGLPVGNTPGVLTDTTADMAWALMMAAARRIPEGERYVHEGKWKTWGPLLLLGPDIHDSTLGIVGMGRIGQAMARRAQGFNMRVLYYDDLVPQEAVAGLGAQKVSLEELLAQSDFVTIHVPLMPETRRMFSTERFKQMKPSAIVINTSRGPVVDPKALYEALRDGEIAYAALDVTDPEPIPMDDPLLSLPNCLIVPHIASASFKTRSLMSTMAADNLLAGLKGERLPTCVNPEVYNR